MLNHPSESIYLFAIGIVLLRNADLGEDRLDRGVLLGVAIAATAASALAFAVPGTVPSAMGAVIVVALVVIFSLGGVPGLRLALPSGSVLRRRAAETVLTIVLAVTAKFLWSYP